MKKVICAFALLALPLAAQAQYAGSKTGIVDQNGQQTGITSNPLVVTSGSGGSNAAAIAPGAAAAYGTPGEYTNGSGNAVLDTAATPHPTTDVSLDALISGGALPVAPSTGGTPTSAANPLPVGVQPPTTPPASMAL